MSQGADYKTFENSLNIIESFEGFNTVNPYEIQINVKAFTNCAGWQSDSSVSNLSTVESLGIQTYSSSSSSQSTNSQSDSSPSESLSSSSQQQSQSSSSSSSQTVSDNSQSSNPIDSCAEMGWEDWVCSPGSSDWDYNDIIIVITATSTTVGIDQNRQVLEFVYTGEVDDYGRAVYEIYAVRNCNLTLASKKNGTGAYEYIQIYINNQLAATQFHITTNSTPFTYTTFPVEAGDSIRIKLRSNYVGFSPGFMVETACGQTNIINPGSLNDTLWISPSGVRRVTNIFRAAYNVGGISIGGGCTTPPNGAGLSKTFDYDGPWVFPVPPGIEAIDVAISGSGGWVYNNNIPVTPFEILDVAVTHTPGITGSLIKRGVTTLLEGAGNIIVQWSLP